MVAVRGEVHGQDALHMPLQCHDAATCACIPHTSCTMHVTSCISSHDVYAYNVSTQQSLQEVAVHVLQRDLRRQPVESLCRAKAACYVCMINSTVGAMCPMLAALIKQPLALSARAAVPCTAAAATMTKLTKAMPRVYSP